MKKISLLCLAASLFFLTSCETTRDITIEGNGSGKIVTTIDMSQLAGIMKMSGQGKEMEGKNLDSTISLSAFADSIPNLAPQEKELLKKGTMGMVMNLEDEKMLTNISFPFASVTDINKVQKLSGTLLQQMMKKEMESKGGAPGGMPEDQMPQASFEGYYNTTFSPGVIESKLDKEKYAKISEDKAIQGMKEAVDQGMPIVNRYVFHLPKPAKKVEGASVKLSDDKKTVTVEGDMGDFFEDATKLEFRVEY